MQGLHLGVPLRGHEPYLHLFQGDLTLDAVAGGDAVWNVRRDEDEVGLDPQGRLESLLGGGGLSYAQAWRGEVLAQKVGRAGLPVHDENEELVRP